MKGWMMMLTFKMDCQLNDNEDWIAEGTKVEIDNRLHNTKNDCTWVKITKAFSFEGQELQLNESHLFLNISFTELSKEAK
jgi:hypothetical protein